MADEWFYFSDEEQRGPISSKEMRTLAATGKLKPVDLVWKESVADWIPASRLKGLFPGQHLSGSEHSIALSAEPSPLSTDAAPSTTRATPGLSPVWSSKVKSAFDSTKRRFAAMCERGTLGAKEFAVGAKVASLVANVAHAGKRLTLKQMLIAVAMMLVLVVAYAVSSKKQDSITESAEDLRVSDSSILEGLQRAKPLGASGPSADYSKVPNGETPEPLTMFLVLEGQKWKQVPTLENRKGNTISGFHFRRPDGQDAYHGKVAWTNEVGDTKSRILLDVALSMILRGKGEMYFRNGIPEGTLTLWYPNGQKWLELPYVAGMRHGLARTWNDNGAEKFSLMFVGDKRQGRFVEYHAKGGRIEEGGFKDNERHGAYTQWYWDANGVYGKSFEGTYDCGTPIGVHRRYSDKGELISVEGHDDANESESAVGSNERQDVSTTFFTKKAIAMVQAVNPYQGRLKAVSPGSKADLLQAMKVLGARVGVTFVEDGIEEKVCVLRYEEYKLDAVCGKPELLSDRYDTFIKAHYQRWRYQCTDGPITMHGNTGNGFRSSTRACFY